MRLYKPEVSYRRPEVTKILSYKPEVVNYQPEIEAILVQ